MAQPGMEDPSEQSQDAPEGGGQFQQMVTSVSSNLMQIQKLLAGEGAPEELTAKLGELNDQYQAILQEIMKSLGGADQGPKRPGSPGTGMVDAQGGVGGVPV